MKTKMPRGVPEIHVSKIVLKERLIHFTVWRESQMKFRFQKAMIVKVAIVLLAVILVAKAYEYCSQEPELTDNVFFDLMESEYFGHQLLKVVEVECTNPKDNSTCLYIIDKIGYRDDGSWFVGRFLTPASSLDHGFLSVSKLKTPIFKSKSAIYTKDWIVDVGIMDPATPNGVEIATLFSTGHFETNRDISGQIHFIGVATGSLMSYVGAYFKNMNLIGVDIDANSEYLAKKWFGYKSSRNSRVLIGNGAEFIRDMALNGEQTNAVLVDACHNHEPADGLYCPVEAIRTPEFLENLSKVIGARGITVFNVFHTRGSPEKYATLKSSFSNHFAFCKLFDKVRMLENVFLICANYDFEKRKMHMDRKKVVEFLDEIRLQKFLVVTPRLILPRLHRPTAVRRQRIVFCRPPPTVLVLSVNWLHSVDLHRENMRTFILIFCFVNVSRAFPASAMSLTLHDVTDQLDGDDQKYSEALKIAGEVFNEVESLFNDDNYASRIGWFKDESNDDGDVVYAKDTPHGRMVTISTELPMSADEVIKETWEGMETLPHWNQNINFASRIASPTSNFDIVTYGNNDVLVVSGREFVSTRIWRKVDDAYILASRSVTVPSFKSKHKGKVRAHLHLAGARFRPNPADPSSTLTDVVMLADLKGYIPKMVVNKVIGRVMLMDTVTNRKHFTDLKEKRAKNNQ